MKSTFFVTLPKINIYQKGSGILFSGGTQILLFNILLFDKIKYFYSTYMLFNLEFSLRNFAETFTQLFISMDVAFRFTIFLIV